MGHYGIFVIGLTTIQPLHKTKPYSNFIVNDVFLKIEETCRICVLSLVMVFNWLLVWTLIKVFFVNFYFAALIQFIQISG